MQETGAGHITRIKHKELGALACRLSGYQIRVIKVIKILTSFRISMRKNLPGLCIPNVCSGSLTLLIHSSLRLTATTLPVAVSLFRELFYRHI